MEITFILKGSVELLPPILPRMIYLSKKGFSINLICTKVQKSTAELFEQFNIKYRETLHNDKFLFRSSRILDWLGFRSKCKKILESYFKNSNLIYVSSADTALCLNSLLNKYTFILQSNELYDQLPLYRYGLKKYVHKAKAFVVPEMCRANICMCWYDLKKMPHVIPNIPYILSNSGEQKISDTNAANILSKLNNKKIILYQGHIQTGDRSLSCVAEALRKINNCDYALVLMGRNHNRSFEQLKEIYTDTYYIPFIAAPYHLEVTSHAHIALLAYDKKSLNNLFCAPNKIYEYSSLGVPMLGNDIPGLTYTVEHNNMGVCCSYESTEAVMAAIKTIESHHTEYSKNAKRFFEASDLEGKMDGLIRDVLGVKDFE